MSHVPKPSFTDTGFVPPLETAVLQALHEDWSEVFGVELNFGTVTNPTPQGQLTASEAAIIGDANDTFCALANGVDPAFASGREQDAIARIYFLTRLPAQSTVAACLCVGLSGTIIPPGALIQSPEGLLYSAVSGGTIPVGGSVTLDFACQTVGPITCPADTLNRVYRTIPGWDSVNNPTDGVLGNNVESRRAFETRRQLSVAHNTVGFIPSVLGAILADVDGVLDAYVTDNPNGYQVGFTPIGVAQCSIAGTTLTVDSLTSGFIAIGQSVTGSSTSNVPVADGTVVTGGSGTSWTVNNSQTVALSEMNFGGVVLGKNCLYAAAVGGTDLAVATAVWSKKSPGCAYYAGNTSVTVYDTSVQVPPPGQPYTVVFERPSSLPFVFRVDIADSPDVPANVTQLVQAAVIAAFAGADGGQRARIGYPVYASRFYPPVAALGSWANVVALLISSPNHAEATGTVAVGASFSGSGSGTTLTVSGTTGYISDDDIVAGSGVPSGTTIVSQLSGTTGGDGTYETSVATTASGTVTTQSAVAVVSAVSSGTLAAGQFLFDSAGNLDEGTEITGQLSGTTGAAGRYTISIPQRVLSESFQAVVADQVSVNVQINQAPTVIAACIEVNLI